jgi:hypothetical protein
MGASVNLWGWHGESEGNPASADNVGGEAEGCAEAEIKVGRWLPIRFRRVDLRSAIYGAPHSSHARPCMHPDGGNQ